MSTREIAAMGVFVALAYAGSFLLMAIPNATLSILLVFYAGYYLRTLNGMVVGIFAALLISLFNPYGIAMLPILLGQVIGYAIIGALGGVSRRMIDSTRAPTQYLILALLGLITAVAYQLPVSISDAWLFGPFRERLTLSAGYALITIISNVIFFVILFPALAKLKKLAIFQLNR